MKRPKPEVLFLASSMDDLSCLIPLMESLQSRGTVNCSIFSTGTTTLERYGTAAFSAEDADRYLRLGKFINQNIGDPPERIIAAAMEGLIRFIGQDPPDLLVARGDGCEALAAAMVGALHNIRTLSLFSAWNAHGGYYKALSRLAHVHFVSHHFIAERLRQWGEEEDRIHIVGALEDSLVDKVPAMPVGQSNAADIIAINPTLEDARNNNGASYDAIFAASTEAISPSFMLPRSPGFAAHWIEYLDSRANKTHTEVWSPGTLESQIVRVRQARNVYTNDAFISYCAARSGRTCIDPLTGSRQDTTSDSQVKVANIKSDILGTLIERIQDDAVWQVSLQKQVIAKVPTP